MPGHLSSFQEYIRPKSSDCDTHLARVYALGYVTSTQKLGSRIRARNRQLLHWHMYPEIQNRVSNDLAELSDIVLPVLTVMLYKSRQFPLLYEYKQASLLTGTM